MPIYAYGCRNCPGRRAEVYRSIAERDEAPVCEVCEVPMARRISILQRPIIHAAGWNLRPGDRGYWDFETKDGRASSWQQKQIAPFAKQEDFEKNPPQAVPTDTPVFSEDYR